MIIVIKLADVKLVLEKRSLIYTGRDSRITMFSRLMNDRVAEGLSLDSHAANCAEIFGIPSRLVQRAQYVRLA